MKTTVAEAVGYGLSNLGVEVVTHVPGYGASEAFMAYKTIAMKNPYMSFNEEVAYTIAHAAGIVGKRSALIIKAHGILKATNSIVDSLYTDVTAGFVTIIFEDHSGKSSDNILEIKPILDGIGIPYKVADYKNVYQSLLACYKESEERKLPYVLVIDADHIGKETEANIEERLLKKFEYKRQPLRHIVHPLLAEYQFKLFTTKKLAGDYSALTNPPLPAIPDDIPERVKSETLLYKEFFGVFRDYRGEVVCGDTTLSSYYAFAPYNCIDIVTYMGGSIPLAVGAYCAGKRDVWALCGDFGFISAAHMGLIEIFQRQLPIKIVIFNNKKAASTGGQLINKQILFRMLCGNETNIIHITDPQNPLEIGRVLNEVSRLNEFKIILVDY